MELQNQLDSKMKILLVEDNQTIAKQLVEFLSAQQWQLDYAHTGKLALTLATSNVYDLVLLDLNLPDIDGLEVCQQIKAQSEKIPAILMLTARDSFDDKAAGFGFGADDYLTKPFDLRELALRCQALTRRQQLHQENTISLAKNNSHLLLKIMEKSAFRDDNELKLTTVGFTILNLLMQHHPQSISRSLLIHELWGDSPPESDALKSHIYSLRQALDKPFEKALLSTVMNVGYKLSF